MEARNCMSYFWLIYQLLCFESLDLSCNALVRLSANMLYGMPKLQKLALVDNQIIYLEVTMFKHLSSLITLNSSNYRLCRISRHLLQCDAPIELDNSCAGLLHSVPLEILVWILTAMVLG